MAKKILYQEEARRALLKGVDALANAVKVTLGPRGRTVLIERKFGSPLIVNDGVTVAKEIDLKEPIISPLKLCAGRIADLCPLSWIFIAGFLTGVVTDRDSVRFR